jgi:flagellin
MGSFSILNNIAGINSQNQLNVNNVNLTRTLGRLASGKRINSGADDAAGLQIADSLKANVQALNQASRNANDGISVLQIADGALQQITNLLTRGVTLAEEAATETIDTEGKKALDQEFTQIKAEIQRISEATNFNGQVLFTSGAFGNNKLDIYVGDISNAGAGSTSANTITVSIGTISSSAISSPTGAIDLDGKDLLTEDKAKTALTNLKDALNGVATMRGSLGAGMNRLQAAISVIQTQSQNTLSAESAIRDANIAEEVSEMTKQQILAQSGMAALAQANSNSQSVLSLLR